MTTIPAKNDFTIYKGATFQEVFVYKDSAGAVIDLTGYTAKMQIRPMTSSDEVIADLTTENGGITLTSEGLITILISADDTAAITQDVGEYDFLLINTTKDFILKGSVTITQGVTQ